MILIMIKEGFGIFWWFFLNGEMVRVNGNFIFWLDIWVGVKVIYLCVEGNKDVGKWIGVVE